MSIAQYNRGTAAISRQIDEQLSGSDARVALEPNVHGTDARMIGPKMPTLKYWNLVDDPRLVAVGDRVYCTVSACRGWMTVTEVKGTRSNLRIKTDAFGRQWGYAHNFTFNPPDWMLK